MKFRKFLPCRLFLVLVILTVFTPPAMADTSVNRLSLAISGGASKGAYEAGLIWGLIEILRHVNNSEYWSLGGQPRHIEIVSMAGTSAPTFSGSRCDRSGVASRKSIRLMILSACSFSSSVS